MSWLEVEDQEPDLGDVKSVILMNNHVEITDKQLVIRVWSPKVINYLSSFLIPPLNLLKTAKVLKLCWD